jgi:hypothetical protein
MRGRLNILCDEATMVLDSLKRSVTKEDSNRKLDDKFRTAEATKVNLMAAGLNKNATEAQRIRVAELAVWMDEAKNAAKKVKKDRTKSTAASSGCPRTPSTAASTKGTPKRESSIASSSLNSTMKQKRVGTVTPPKQAPP